MGGRGRRLDVGEEAQLRRLLADAAYRANLIRLNAYQLEAAIMAVGLLTPDATKRVRNELAEALAGPNRVSLCGPVGAAAGGGVDAPYDPRVQPDPLHGTLLPAELGGGAMSGEVAPDPRVNYAGRRRCRRAAVRCAGGNRAGRPLSPPPLTSYASERMDFDLILAGGGLANGLTLLRLAAVRPEVRVAIVERGATIGGNHSWSSFEADITPAQVAWTAPLMAHRWDRYSIRFPELRRTLTAGYRTATSTTLAAAVAATGAAVVTSANIIALDATCVTLADQRTLTAAAVVDGRGQGRAAGLTLRAQKFLGLEVELTAPHDLDGPVIMDATVAQVDGYRFVYVLPFGPRTVLVEDTYYSDGNDLAPDLVRGRVRDYIAAQGWTVARVVREEVGVLPIALGGDIASFWDAAPRVAASGLRAALFNPITGYSFPDAVRVADLIAGLPSLDPASLYAALRHHSEATWRARGFYRLLNRMLFDAAEPDQRWRVLQRFYRLDAGLVRRFYAGQSTGWDKLRTLAGRPPVPIGRALGVLLRS